MCDYAYNACRYYNIPGVSAFITRWATFCENYDGTQTQEGPFHKYELQDNKLVRVASDEDIIKFSGNLNNDKKPFLFSRIS